MALSCAADIDAFLAGSGTVSITYLDALGFTCGGADANMVRLQRPKGSGLITIRIDAGDAAPVLQQLMADANKRRQSLVYPQG
jgi:hypothetical protein